MTDAKDKRIAELEARIRRLVCVDPEMCGGTCSACVRALSLTPREITPDATALPPRCTHQVPAGNARTTRMVDCGRDEPCPKHPGEPESKVQCAPLCWTEVFHEPRCSRYSLPDRICTNGKHGAACMASCRCLFPDATGETERVGIETVIGGLAKAIREIPEPGEPERVGACHVCKLTAGHHMAYCSVGHCECDHSDEPESPSWRPEPFETVDEAGNRVNVRVWECPGGCRKSHTEDVETCHECKVARPAPDRAADLERAVGGRDDE